MLMANTRELNPNELSRARRLLQQVTASLRGPAPAIHGQETQDPVLELGVPPQGSVTLRLVSYRPTRLGDWHAIPNTVLVLRKATASLLERLRREHANFVDIGRGIARLELPGLLIDRSDLRVSLRPMRHATSRPLRSPFGNRASLVSRLLARMPGKAWRLRELAAAAKVSTMTASHVVRQLAAIGAVHVTTTGRAKEIRFTSLRTLVEHWSHHYDWTRNRRVPVLAPVGDPQRFLSRLPEILGRERWALTMHAGASLIAPIAAWEKVHVYVRIEQGARLDELVETLGYEASDDGALVLMRPWYHDSVWTDARSIHALPVVSLLQLVLDLWHYPVRGREQAEHLLRTATTGVADS